MPKITRYPDEIDFLQQGYSWDEDTNVVELGDRYEITFRSPELFRVILSRVMDDKRSINADIAVHMELKHETDVGRRKYRDHYNLSTHADKMRIVKQLTDICDHIQWGTVLEECYDILMNRRYNNIDVSFIGGDRVIEQEDQYLVDGLLLNRGPNLIYGVGGSGKSMIALYAAICMSAGIDMFDGHKTKRCKVALFDWEFDDIAHHERLLLLSRGLGIKPPEILYTHRMNALQEDMQATMEITRSNGAEHIIADSGTAACGGEPEKSDVVSKFFTALRQLKLRDKRIGTTIIHHPPKNSRIASPFGSVYWFNYSRSVIHMESTRGSDGQFARTTFTHEKNNCGPQHKEFSLDWNYDNGIGFKLFKGDSLSEKILKLITNGPLTAAQIAEQTGAKQGTVATTLGRMKADGVVLNKQMKWWLV